MEKSKQKGSSSSSSSTSSIATELFGPKEPSSSRSVFSSVFDQPPISGKWRNSQQGKAYYESRHGRPPADLKDRASYYQQETVGPCHLSSSIYYGGQEVYSPATCKTDAKPQYLNKDERDDDQADGGNLHGTSRGNWWKGSLYY